VEPVPDHPLADTPYGRRGPYWSCDRDAHGNGIHTGVDYAAPAGARVVAARPGTLAHCNHGSAFGSHQVEVRCADGTRDFYAHMRTRRAPGPVDAGTKVGEVGSEGNATGPHLHFERHSTTTGGWSCAVVRDPQPSIDWQAEEMTEDEWGRMETLIGKVWAEQMTVTQPGTGQDTTKSRQQVLRELWQKVTKAT
jgi:murein DD-endopeptidase MepM/ murein hydrolase activator NlpD